MDTFFQYAGVALDAVLEAGRGVGHVLHQVVGGAWVEAVIVAVALHIYYSYGQAFAAAGAKHKSVQPRAGSASRAKSRGTSGKSLPKNSDSKQVHKLVASLLGKGGRYVPQALEQYDQLVRLDLVDMRRHIHDEQNARSLYIALVDCGLHADAPPAEYDRYGLGESMSIARLWTRRLLQDMRTFGFPYDGEFYAELTKLYMNRQLFRDALSLHADMVAEGISPDRMMNISMMNVAITCGENDLAIYFFGELSKQGSPSMRTYMTVLRVYGKKKDWQGAASLLEAMNEAGNPPDNLVLNSVLGLCVSGGQVELAERLMGTFKEVADVISCNILIKGFAQQADFQRADAVLRTMLSQGPAPNIITFNTVMDCVVRSLQVLCAADKNARSAPHNNNTRSEDSGKIDEAGGSSHSFLAVARRPWELLEQLIGLGLEPDRYTCSTLVKGMHLSGCSVAEIDRAVSLLRSIGPVALQSPGVGAGGSSADCNARLLEVLFNTLLDACVSIRDLDRMASIFEMMQEYRVGVSAVTFGTLVKAFGQAKRLARCHEVWEDMRKASIRPTIVTYGCYIDACIRNEAMPRAETILASMAEEGIRPNAVIYTSLIRGFAHATQPYKALEIYRRMRREGIQPTPVTFNSVLDVIARQLSETALLQEVIDDMCNANITPDVVTYSILMKASCSAGNVNNALTLFRQIRSHGFVFDQVAFNTLLLACSKAEQVADAEEIFEEMRRSGTTPSNVTTSILVKMYGRAKMLEKAIAVSELIEREYGRAPNLFVYTCLIQACVQNKHVRRSWDVFNQMLQAGIAPDAITYGTMIHGCVYLNKFDYAMTLVRQAYQRPTPDDSQQPKELGSTPSKSVISLQPDVLQMLLAALRRKEYHVLATELEELVGTATVAGAGVVDMAPRTRRQRLSR